MKDIQAPFLEFGFYSHNQKDDNFFNQLVFTLMTLGASAVDSVLVDQQGSYTSKPFVSIYDYEVNRVPVKSNTVLVSLLNDRQHRVLHVNMNGATNTTHGVSEHVTYTRISEEASHVNPHPVVIQTSGEYFCSFDHVPEVATRSFLSKSQQMGLRAYERFVAILAEMTPSYATISVERSIRCPYDLGHGGDSYLFRDFYISGHFVGERQLAHLLQLYSGAYMMQIKDGIFISTSRWLNPEGRIYVPSNAYVQSNTVSQIIAEAGL